jgi:pimeloyl-ACP methyl ester carboxylesterase
MKQFCVIPFHQSVLNLITEKNLKGIENQHREIPIPVLVITATDDPLVPPNNIPRNITTWHSKV